MSQKTTANTAACEHDSIHRSV